MSFIKKAVLVGHVINQGRKIYNGRHACLTKENNSLIIKCDGIITNCDSLVYYKVRWTVFYSHTFIFMLSSNKVWEKRLISGLSQAGTAWLRKSSRYDSRDFWAGLGGPSTSSRLR